MIVQLASWAFAGNVPDSTSCDNSYLIVAFIFGNLKCPIFSFTKAVKNKGGKITTMNEFSNFQTVTIFSSYFIGSQSKKLWIGSVSHWQSGEYSFFFDVDSYRRSQNYSCTYTDRSVFNWEKSSWFLWRMFSSSKTIVWRCFLTAPC